MAARANQCAAMLAQLKPGCLINVYIAERGNNRIHQRVDAIAGVITQRLVNWHSWL